MLISFLKNLNINFKYLNLNYFCLLLSIVFILNVASCKKASNIFSNNKFLLKGKIQPSIVIWLWDRHIDLSSLSYYDEKKLRNLEFAYLVGTLIIEKDEVKFYPNLHFPALPSIYYKHPVILVIRVINKERKFVFYFKQRRYEKILTQYIYNICAQNKWREFSNIIGCQIDFDFRNYEKKFVYKVTKNLKKLLANKIISLNIAPSWCYDNNFLTNLNLDEIVPMLYSKNGNLGLTFLLKEEKISPLCKRSVGIIIDDLKNLSLDGNNIVFNKIYIWGLNLENLKKFIFLIKKLNLN